MSGVYEDRGIRFQFPENWSLDEEDGLDGSVTVHVTSPSGAFWSIAIHRPEQDPEKLVTAAVEAMRAEYQELDAEAAEERIADEKLTGYDLNFICLDLTNTALVRGFQSKQNTYLVFCQAEDREYERLKLVFRAITTSLFLTAGAGVK